MVFVLLNKKRIPFAKSVTKKTISANNTAFCLLYLKKNFFGKYNKKKLLKIIKADPCLQEPSIKKALNLRCYDIDKCKEFYILLKFKAISGNTLTVKDTDGKYFHLIRKMLLSFRQIEILTKNCEEYDKLAAFSAYNYGFAPALLNNDSKCSEIINLDKIEINDFVMPEKLQNKLSKINKKEINAAVFCEKIGKKY